VRYVLVLAMAVWAGEIGCGGGGGGGADDDDDDGGPGDDAGSTGDGGGDSDAGTTPHDRYRFASETVATSVFVESVALFAGDTPVFGYDATVATRSGGVWSAATLPDGDVAALEVVGGTTWALVDNTGQLSVAFSSGGAWSVESVPGSNDGGSLAVAPDGTVYVAYGGGNGGTGVASGLVLARRSSDGVWTYRLVVPAASNVPEYVDVALVGDEPWIVWHDRNASNLKLSMVGASAVTTETVDDSLLLSDHEVAIAIDGEGRAHVAYRQNTTMLREIEYAVREVDGTWSHEVVAALRHGASGDVRLALSSSGTVAVAYLDTDGVSLATRENGAWFTQPIMHEGLAVDLGFDAAGVLQVALSTRALEIRLFTLVGTYPADYDAACDAIAETLCPLACACGPSCCIGGEVTQECASPEGFCEYVAHWLVCGDASRAPELTYACRDTASTSVCPAGGGVLEAPASCVD
jgi:hypothetical protein